MPVAVGVGEIRGVRETIAVLRKVEPKIAYAATNKIKAPAQSTGAKLRVTAQRIPLSGMAKDPRSQGPVKVNVKYGGKKKANHTWNLVSIRLYGPKWTVASDMAAGAKRPNYTMSRNLTEKFGVTPSRWAWPVVEKNLPRMQVAIAAACREVEIQASDAMRVYGKVKL